MNDVSDTSIGMNSPDNEVVMLFRWISGHSASKSSIHSSRGGSDDVCFSHCGYTQQKRQPGVRLPHPRRHGRPHQSGTPGARPVRTADAKSAECGAGRKGVRPSCWCRRLPLRRRWSTASSGGSVMMSQCCTRVSPMVKSMMNGARSKRAGRASPLEHGAVFSHRLKMSVPSSSMRSMRRPTSRGTVRCIMRSKWRSSEADTIIVH